MPHVNTARSHTCRTGPRNARSRGGQAALETRDGACDQALPQDRREPARVHGAPQVLGGGLKVLRVVEEPGQQIFERPARNQLDILGEHGEQRPHEEARHVLGGVIRFFQELGQLGQPLRQFA
ncbi:MAG: hypothetical protein WCN98_21270, partial [Verrucomicrobiaceae bacterium]